MVESKHQWKAWLYLSPALLLLLVFTGWPIVNTLYMAFMNSYDAGAAIGGTTFQFGINNFLEVIQDDEFFNVLKNTTILCVATVPISTILALLIAVALNSIKFLQKGLQTVFFLPYVTNSIAIGMVFAAMFNIIGLRPNGSADTYGIVNWVLNSLGILQGLDNLFLLIENLFHINLDVFGINFFVDPDTGVKTYFVNWMNQNSTYEANIAVMVVYIVWNALPFKILVLLGGLQSINRQYYDAAKVDGTPRARVLTKITVPLLSPMLAYVIITGFIGGFKEYSSIVGVFGDTMGPPARAYRLNTMVGVIYNALEGGSGGTHGEASAAALILFAIILVVTMINLQVSKKRVHY